MPLYKEMNAIKNNNTIEQKTCGYQLLRAQDLKEADWDIWERLHLTGMDLDSPFFHPRFTQAVAAVRDDVEVVLVQEGQETVGFFPFQRCRGNSAQSIGGRLSEFHGVIIKPGVQWCPKQLIREAGLCAYHFDHLPSSQAAFKPYSYGETDSSFMDLTGGYEAYRVAIKNKGTSLSQIERKSRKICREVGPLNFVLHSQDDSTFQALLRWKHDQHVKTGVLEVLKIKWVTDLLESIRKTQTKTFAGQLSALYSGNYLIAVHLGIRSQTALHIWFPAYSVEFEKYSPGMILLQEMAKVLAVENLQRIDFGRGEEQYKTNLQTGTSRIAEGAINFNPFSNTFRKNWFITKRWIRSSPYRRQLELPLIASRKIRQRLNFK